MLLRKLEKDFFQKRHLEHSFSLQHSTTIEEHKEEVQSKVLTASKERQQRKLHAMLARQNTSQKRNDRCVINLSSKQLTDPQVSALLKGSELCPHH